MQYTIQILSTDKIEIEKNAKLSRKPNSAKYESKIESTSDSIRNNLLDIDSINLKYLSLTNPSSAKLESPLAVLKEDKSWNIIEKISTKG